MNPGRKPCLRALILIGLVLCACNEDQAIGEVVGTLNVPDCRDGMAVEFACGNGVSDETCQAFDLQANFFALQIFEGQVAKLRIQRSGVDFALTDALVLEIRDTRLLRGRLGDGLEVNPDGNIRAGLGLFQLCPDSTQNFELRGTVAFDEFGLAKGDRIRGRIQRLEVRDGRNIESGGAVLGLLRGHFDFILQTGPPYERFPE